MEITYKHIKVIELTSKEVSEFKAEMDMIFDNIDNKYWESMNTLRDIRDLI